MIKTIEKKFECKSCGKLYKTIRWLEKHQQDKYHSGINNIAFIRENGKLKFIKTNGKITYIL